MKPPTVIASVADPEGRSVILDADGWQHILDNHPEMVGHQTAVLTTVNQPEHRRPDPRPGRVRYYRQGVGPSRWCLAVIDATQDPARVVTAFGTRRDPEGWHRR